MTPSKLVEEKGVGREANSGEIGIKRQAVKRGQEGYRQCYNWLTQA